MSNGLPTLKRKCATKGKITVYFEEEFEQLFKVGKENGWDTPSIAREAVKEVLTKMAEQLKQPAP